MVTAIDIAQVCHEANRALQLINGEDVVSPVWEEAPDWQKESAIDGVKKALSGLTPVELHENWSNVRRADGWVYGPVKDEVAKTHHCLVPYEQLPASQQLKDHLFSSIVHTLKGGK